MKRVLPKRKTVILTVVDRTSELRKRGYVGRRLGSKQMTTDTAVRVTRMVVYERGTKETPFIIHYLYEYIVVNIIALVPLDQISYVDHPEIQINEHERTEMPFRYVKNDNGQPIMPPVRYSCIINAFMLLIESVH